MKDKVVQNNKIHEYEQIIMDSYLDKIYAFAYKRTQNHFDAEDLSQEILLEVFRSIRTTRNIERLHAWVWGVARNRYYRWLELRDKREKDFVYCEFDWFDGSVAYNDNLPEDIALNRIHREVSYLSYMHRRVFISYYLMNMKCHEIACKENIPEGSVKRILSESRKYIKKGVKNMNEPNRKYHSPPALCIRCGDSYGPGPNPKELLSHRIIQTILLEAYGKARSISEISSETGIPCIYLEDEAEKLIACGMLEKKGRDSIQSTITIRNQSLRNVLIDFMKQSISEIIPEYDKIIDHIKSMSMKENIKNKDLAWESFLWIALYRVFSNAYHCSKWSSRYTGNQSESQRQSFGFTIDENYSDIERIAWGWHDKPRGVIMPGKDGCGFVAWKTYWSLGQRLLCAGKPALYGEEVELCERIVKGKLNFDQVNEAEKTLLAELVGKGAVSIKADEVLLDVPCFTKGQHQRLDEIIRAKHDKLVNIYEKIITEGIRLVRNYVPKNITEHNVENFVLSGQGVGGIAGLIYNEYVTRGELCQIDPIIQFSPTCYLIVK